MNAFKEPCGRILWYVSGTLEPDDLREFEEHLLACDRCRQDADAFGSMMRSLRRQSLTDHVATEELIAYEEETLPAAGRRRQAIAHHLEGCATCRADLDRLAMSRRDLQAHEVGAAAPRPRPARSSRPRGAAMAAGFFLGGAALSAVLFALSGGEPEGGRPPMLLASVQSAVFHAPLRGAEPPRVLTGSGPWVVTVTLPFGAPDGLWELSIRDNAGRLLGSATTARNRGDGHVHILIEEETPAGRYRLVARSIELAGEPHTIYPFDISPTAEVAAP